MVKREVLVIKCASKDVPIDFRVLAIRIGADHEETLRQLLELEKRHPLMKRAKGLVERL